MLLVHTPETQEEPRKASLEPPVEQFTEKCTMFETESDREQSSRQQSPKRRSNSYNIFDICLILLHNYYREAKQTTWKYPVT